MCGLSVGLVFFTELFIITQWIQGHPKSLTASLSSCQRHGEKWRNLAGKSPRTYVEVAFSLGTSTMDYDGFSQLAASHVELPDGIVHLG